MIDQGLLFWLDLEMTGLNPREDHIIEVASVVTDSALRTVEVGPHVVVFQEKSVLDSMDDWNTKHHSLSGLIQDVKCSTTTTQEAEKQTLDFLTKYGEKQTIPLAGNSVHHDRMFLYFHMPKLFRWVHYRIVDVSSIKVLVQHWYPDVYAKRPSKKGHHRARDDIFESIEELKFYRENVFCKL